MKAGSMPDVEAGGAVAAEETRLLETIPASQQLSLSFTHISGYVPTQLMSPSMATKVKKAVEQAVTTTKQQRQAAGFDTKQVCTHLPAAECGLAKLCHCNEVVRAWCHALTMLHVAWHAGF